MEREKRIYPVGRNKIRAVNICLLAFAALIVLNGLISKNAGNGFAVETIPQATKVPLNDAFDETMTETVLEIPGQSWFALQVGVFESEESAQEASSVFQKRGAAGYLWQDGRFRVLAAAYPNREDAQIVREQIRDSHGIESYLYTITFPTLRLKLTGMQGQIEILQAAFAHADDLAKQIQNLSIRMDRQEISVPEAKEEISALNTQMQLVTLRLQQRFQAPMPSAVQALIECFQNYELFSQTVEGNESAAALGMKLKYQLFETLKHIQKTTHTLNHT